MPRISQFSPRVIEGVRQFYEAHPVFSIEQLAEIELEGPGAEPVQVDYATCDRCGFQIRPADNPVMFDGRVWTRSTIENVRLTHEYTVADRGVRCGGHMVIKSAPVVGPVGLRNH